MIICSPANKTYSCSGKYVCHSFRILYDLCRIAVERGAERLAKADGLCGNEVHNRTALKAGEQHLVYLLRNLLILVREDHPAAWATKRFMRRGEHHVETVVKRIFHRLPCDNTSDVCYISHDDSSNLATNLSELCIIELARIRGEAGHDNLRFLLFCDDAHLIVINFACFNILHLVADEVKYLCDVGHGVPMC